MENAAGNADEWDYQNEFKRVDDVVAELRSGHVKAKDKRYCEAEDGGASKNWVDADEEAGGDAPGEFFRGSAHAKECQDGEGDAAIDPVVMEGLRDAEVGFGRLHLGQDRLRNEDLFG